MVHKPQIVQAADAIAYLPLYIAEQSQIALELPDGSTLSWDQAFDEPFRNPPDEYLKGIKGEHKRTGDQGCLNSIRQAWESKVPLIGVCDPSNVVDFADLVIVGGFITRACFWCLVDSDVPAAKNPEGLSVSHLFIHDRGFLTGHRIGDEVGKRLPNHGDGDPFIVDGSFDLLVDGAIWAKNNIADSTVAAISPSILSCILAEDRGFRIAFAMHELPEYQEFLTTALVVHRDALKLLNVRHALKLLVRTLPKVQAYANSWGKVVEDISRLCNNEGRFTSERRLDSAKVVGHAVIPNGARQPSKLADITIDQAKRVWNALSSIYSPDCDITETAWNNAIGLAGKKKGGLSPKLHDYYDPSILEEARKERFTNESSIPRLGFRHDATQRERVGVFLIVALALLAGWLVNKVPLWASISGCCTIATLVLWRFFPFGSEPVKKFFDWVIIIIWCCLIGSFLLTLFSAGCVNALKTGENFEDLTAIFGVDGNARWQWWAGRISNVWEVTSVFLGAVIAVVTSGLRGSRAVMLLPKWTRTLIEGRK